MTLRLTVSVILILIFFTDTAFSQNKVVYTFSSGAKNTTCDATVTYSLAGIQNGKMLYSATYEGRTEYLGWSTANKRWELKSGGNIIFYNRTATELYPPCVGIGIWEPLDTSCGDDINMVASNNYCYPFVYYSSDCGGNSRGTDLFYIGMRNGKYAFGQEINGVSYEIFWLPSFSDGSWVIKDLARNEVLFYNEEDTKPLPPDEETGIWKGKNICESFSILGSGGNVVPADLLAFTVEARTKGYEAVWTTSREADIDRFELEYSLDEHNWISVSSIKSQGTTASGMNYYVKFGAGVINTEFYVRLIQYNKDGKFKTFPYVYMQPPELSGPFNFYPNPAHNDLIVEGRIGSELVIFNSVGEVLLKEKLEEAQRILDISNLPHGIYVMKTATGSHAYNKKLVKN